MAPSKELDTSIFSEKARRDLLRLLESIPGKKNLILAKSLVGPIELLVKFSTLQEYGIDRVFFLENDNAEASQRNIVFIASGEKPLQVSAIALQIKRLRNTAQSDHDFTVIWVPRRTLVCNKSFEDEGILGDVTVLELPLHFLPLEDDLFSMELESAFGDLYLRKDPTCVFLAAKALMQVQERHGLFPQIIGKGDNAKRLADLLVRMRSEVSASKTPIANGVPSTSAMPSSTIENLIIIDREVDFPSVLVTQLTYEGLIDETFGIRNGHIEIDPSVIGAVPNQGPPGSSSREVAPLQASQALKRKIKLDATDTLYPSLRDVNFAVVGSLLNKVARRLQSDYETRHGPQKTVSELRDFVSKLPSYQAEQQSLKLHTSLAEEIMKQTSNSEIFGKALSVQQDLIAGADPSSIYDEIEELIAREAPITTVLRLLCLASCVSAGLKLKDFDHFRRLITQAYGHQQLLTLSALQTMQLFEPRISSGLAYLPGTGAPATTSAQHTSYSAIRKALHLILEDVSEASPQDIAYVYSGYAPLSVRLVQAVLQKPYLAALSSHPRTPQTPQSHSRGDSNGTAARLDHSAGWRPFDDALRQIRGATFDIRQEAMDPAAKSRAVLSGRPPPPRAVEAGPDALPPVRTTTLVFFLGGVTYAEVAAVRFVAGKTREAEGRKVLLFTTGMVGGAGAVEAAVQTAGRGGG